MQPLMQPSTQALLAPPQPRRGRLLKRAAAALGAAAGLVHAIAQTAGPALPQRTLDSCVAGTPGIPVGAGEHMAVLDAHDAAALQAAASARWPVLRRHGQAASRVLLLGQGPEPPGWRYVLLEGAQQGTSQPCVMAVLSGQGFGFTPRLVRKYQGGL